MIEIKNVSKVFKRHQVLSDVSLKVGVGERIALVGFNGAGKTTLIRCLLGEYNHAGLITVDGEAPKLTREKTLGKIGFVPQLPPPLKMPVGQLVDFAASLCGTDPKRIEDIAAHLGLEVDDRLRAQPFNKLSGGQKQKMLIAIALGRDAKLLVLDEPAANLDPEARRLFFNLLHERSHDTTMLISSHRLDEVAALVNRVVELDRGRVVLDDQVADAGSMASIFNCHVTLRRNEDVISKTMEAWKFKNVGSGTVWQGVVAGPDRLRFLGVLSRYAGALSKVVIDEHQE